MREVIIKDKTKNLCDYCLNEFATCNPKSIVFGNVNGDNVVLCSSAIWYLSSFPEDEFEYGKIV